MSKETKNSEKRTESKYAIVRAAMKLFKLDDEGHVEKFFKKQVRNFENNIGILKANISQLKLSYKAEKDALLGAIEDAEDNLNAAKLAVDPEAIRSNGDIVAFTEQYWNTIDLRKAELQAIKNALTDLEDDHKDEVKAVEVEIKDTQADIDMIVDMK